MRWHENKERFTDMKRGCIQFEIKTCSDRERQGWSERERGGRKERKSAVEDHWFMNDKPIWVSLITCSHLRI